MNEEEAQRKLLGVIRNVAEGQYSNDIMEFTRDEFPESMRTVAEAVSMMMVKVEAREFRLEGLIEELKALNEQIKRNTIGAVSAMAQALAARDVYTEGHTSRVAGYAETMALKLGMTEKEAEYVRIGAQLHDIGKIGFSDALFTEHGLKNDPSLLKEIVKHPKLGATISFRTWTFWVWPSNTCTAITNAWTAAAIPGTSKATISPWERRSSEWPTASTP